MSMEKLILNGEKSKEGWRIYPFIVEVFGVWIPLITFISKKPQEMDFIKVSGYL